MWSRALIVLGALIAGCDQRRCQGIESALAPSELEETALFERPIENAIAASAIAVVSADFDGDGTPDLALGRGSTVEVRLRDPSSRTAFSGGVQLSLPSQLANSTGEHRSVVTGDFDGDGAIDLATLTNPLSVFLNDRASPGTFRRVDSGGMRPPETAMVAAQMDQDPAIELVTASLHDSRIRIYDQARAQSAELVMVEEIDIGEQLLDVAAGDVDGDGRTDILTGGTRSNLYVLRRNESGGFDRSVTAGLVGHDIGAGDFDGDGLLDLVGTPGSAVAVALQVAARPGTFLTPIVTPLPATIARTFSIEDLNGDRTPDLLLTEDRLFVLLADPRTPGRFELEGVIAVPHGSFDAAIADFDRDGALDIATGNSLKNEIALTFGKPSEKIAARTECLLPLATPR